MVAGKGRHIYFADFDELLTFHLQAGSGIISHARSQVVSSGC